MAVLGKYELLNEMGSGAMGVVYRARDTMLDREVALKVMRSESQLDKEAGERFRREARSCAQLQHPNLITVYDLGEADGSTYIAMELLEGVDLRAAVKQKIPIPAATKIDLMAQICDGLALAHRHGIIHRDVKPSNLFIHLGKHAKILDFGIARLVTSVLTRTGMILGTPNYMAPEQITGQKCSSRSDLFSVAIVAFEFITGSHPFKAPFIPKRIVNDEPDPLRAADPGLPSVLEDALARGLAKNPDDRYQTAEEFASALRSVLSDCDLDLEVSGENPDSGSDDGNSETVTLLFSPNRDEKDERK